MWGVNPPPAKMFHAPKDYSLRCGSIRKRTIAAGPRYPTQMRRRKS